MSLSQGLFSRNRYRSFFERISGIPLEQSLAIGALSEWKASQKKIEPEIKIIHVPTLTDKPEINPQPVVEDVTKIMDAEEKTKKAKERRKKIEKELDETKKSLDIKDIFLKYEAKINKDVKELIDSKEEKIFSDAINTDNSIKILNPGSLNKASTSLYYILTQTTPGNYSIQLNDTNSIGGRLKSKLPVPTSGTAWNKIYNEGPLNVSPMETHDKYLIPVRKGHESSDFYRQLSLLTNNPNLSESMKTFLLNYGVAIKNAKKTLIKDNLLTILEKLGVPSGYEDKFYDNIVDKL